MNDINEKIKSNMCLYTTVYREINSIDDHNILQQDLDTVEWSSIWLMDFNICKCAILPITKKRNTSIFHYAIFGNTLEHVYDHKYLGVSISHDLYLEKYCNKVTIKSNKTLGLFCL